MTVIRHAASIPADTASRKLHAALTVLGACGIALNFFSFAASYVPIRDIFLGGFLEPDWWSVLPCMLLPLPIAIGYGLWLIHQSIPRWYTTSAYIVATISIVPFLAGTVFDFSSDGVEAIVFPASFLLAFCAAAGLVIRGRGRGQALGGLIAMQAVYVIQMEFWVALGTAQFQTGAWLGIAASLAYLAQIMLVARLRAWPLLLLVPAVVLAAALLIEAG